MPVEAFSPSLINFGVYGGTYAPICRLPALRVMKTPKQINITLDLKSGGEVWLT